MIAIFSVVLILMILLAAVLVRRHYQNRTQAAPPIFSDDLYVYASNIADSVMFHSGEPAGAWLIKRLEKNYQQLFEAYQKLNEVSELDIGAANWLLDNFYVVEEQYKDALIGLKDLKKQKLPIVKDGNYRGLPRVFALVNELVAHSNAVVDEQKIVGFLNSYQEHDMLNSNEICALGLMMKTALIENINRIACTVVESVTETNRAKTVIESGDFQMMKKEMQRYSGGKIPVSFFNYLLSNSEQINENYDVIVKEINDFLYRYNTGSEKIARLEMERQATHEVAMGNNITGLRNLQTIDWSDVFQQLSGVERVLKDDPVYPDMDKDTKNNYRSTIEKLSVKLKTNELTVALKAMELAKKKESTPENHVGYYLLGGGQAELWEAVSGKIQEKWSVRKKFQAYVFSISLVTLLISAVFLLLTQKMAGLFLVVALIPASEIAVTLVNYLCTKRVPPSSIPRMDSKSDLVRSASTLVIVPTLVTSEKKADELISKLELQYAANPEPNLKYAVLADFKDCGEEVTPMDEKIVRQAERRLKELQEKYGEVFNFYYRKRIYSPRQGKWLGWDRKRGAIVELVRFLKGRKDTSIIALNQWEETFQYIITIDADTKLPYKLANTLVGGMVHPLNRPVVQNGAVVEGYGLMTTKIGVDIIDANKSTYSKIFAGQGGIDPYSARTSEIYQDLFQEGIFAGKGIFDIDVFYRVLDQAFPEDTILSHDLLEGSYLRTGFMGDREMIDGFPSMFLSQTARLNRWTRGDWQIAPWLCRKVTDGTGTRRENPIDSISRWKIFDNLRRSLVYPSLFILLVCSFYWNSGGILLFLLAVLMPFFISIIDAVSNKVYKNYGQRFYSQLIYGLKGVLYQALVSVASLPYTTWMLLDGVVKGIYRGMISHKKTLEWVTAADFDAKLKPSPAVYYRKMWINPVVGAAAVLTHPDLFTFLFGAVWILAPYIMFRISSDLEEKKKGVTAADQEILRILARKTYFYFEDFTTEKTNFLTPDNYQLEPEKGTANRTSPTNIGLSLLAHLSARDLGFLSLECCLDRINNTLLTVEKLPKWNGHLYNWYDIKTLDILRPIYVSTVDSGNLIGNLIALKEGIKEEKTIPVFSEKLPWGLYYTLKAGGSEADKPAEPFDIIRWRESLKTDQSLIQTRSGKEIVKNQLFELDKFAGWLQVRENMPESLARKLHFLWVRLSEQMTLEEIAAAPEREMGALRQIRQELKSDGEKGWLTELERSLEKGRESAMITMDYMDQLVQRMEKIIQQADFSCLYDEKRRLFSIGFDVHDNSLNKSYYDLLASEARQTSYIAVASHQVEYDHWSNLGRALTTSDRYQGLVSWTGTMFEYLMPLLLLQNYQNTIFDETYQFVVNSQRNYGRKRGVPWGVSESGFAAFDLEFNYQYKAFGIPELGLKRGLSGDTVIAPYASVLALMVNAKAAMANLKDLIRKGFVGKYGFYEAIDYTPSRQMGNSKYMVVKSFMAHHLGMSLVAIDNVLCANCMQKRFHRDVFMDSGRLLLQEKIPVRAIITKESKEKIEPLPVEKNATVEYVRQLEPKGEKAPEVHLLSGDRTSLLITSDGRGYLKSEELYLGRWRNYDTQGMYGTFFYIQDTEKGTWWNASLAPSFRKPDSCRVIFSGEKAEFFRRDGGFETEMEVMVSPGGHYEIRRLAVTSREEGHKTLEITSCIEVIVTDAAADNAHPAFSNLFIKTQYLPEYHALIARRRPRGMEGEKWAFHMLIPSGDRRNISFETDRMQFIGRNRSLSNPQAVARQMPLSGAEGAVIDPVLALRVTAELEQNQTEKFCFVSGVYHDYQEMMKKIQDLSKESVLQEERMLAARSNVEKRFCGITRSQEKLLWALLPVVCFPSEQDGLQKAAPAKQSGLWPMGISGDMPIVLLYINNKYSKERLKNFLKVHEYLKIKYFSFDLVIAVNEKKSYATPVFDMVNSVIHKSRSREWLGGKGGVFLISCSTISPDQKQLLETAAKVVIRDEIPVYKQLDRDKGKLKLPVSSPGEEKRLQLPADGLEFDNGFGGFLKDGTEYVIQTGSPTPLPWINVIANETFGFTISESGAGFTWCGNSRENQLTPWSNNPVTDPVTEGVELIDSQRGIRYCPYGGTGAVSRTRHGFGYTVFEAGYEAVGMTMTVFVPKQGNVKISLLRVENRSGEKMNLEGTYFAALDFGPNKINTQPKAKVWEEDGIYLHQNLLNGDYPKGAVILAASENCQFIREDGLSKAKWTFSLAAGEKRELVCLLGYSAVPDEAQEARKFLSVSTAQKLLAEVKLDWKKKLGAIKVQTPDKSMDFLLNGWLLYQTISCRLYARAAFYQCGGAFGFRDQLQDSLALLLTDPSATRKQILRHAARQFPEGDVLHWWHEVEQGEPIRGIRTKFSDDLLWLPYCVCRYLDVTGEKELLQEVVPYCDGQLLGDVDELYQEVGQSQLSESIMEHCKKAIARSLELGDHGAPFIGTGDWNDGFSAVGRKGRGESVWLGWFLIWILERFSRYCDPEYGEFLKNHAQLLRNNLNENCWDGNWYVRAFFDNGNPLGSSRNQEGKIDSISQSWSVLSGGGTPEKQRQAMDSLEKYLVSEENGIIKLLTPAFEHSPDNPGYIMGYLPGVRENGGQYTHAAVWAVMAFAELGEGDKAAGLYHMINPINHARTPMEVKNYKIEPYVMAADVYAAQDHIGRGGWSWYTGAAGWMYQAGIESILGMKVERGMLSVSPCIPEAWDGFEMEYVYGNTRYQIKVKNPDHRKDAVAKMKMDGADCPENKTKLTDDGKIHQIVVVME